MKVMIAGKNYKLVTETAKGIERDTSCKTFMCPAVKSKLFQFSLAERPRTAIICMDGETPEEIKIYNVLKEYMKLSNLTVIVIANDEDIHAFSVNTGLPKVIFLKRPFMVTALYDKLEEISGILQKENDLSKFIEFDNLYPPEEFSRKHILVADDDMKQLLRIGGFLREFYEVTMVNSGAQMMKSLEKYKTDLILLDYFMYGRSDPGVLSQIRTLLQYSDIPVVILTGVSDRDIVTKIITELKPQGYLLKSATKSETVAKVIDILG